MLRQSRGHEHQPSLRSVFDSTIGLVFFWTPHEGADPRGLVHNVVMALGKALGKALGFRVNDQILQALLPSAEYLNQLRDEFNRMLDERGWKVHSFQEQYPMQALFSKTVTSSFYMYIA